MPDYTIKRGVSIPMRDGVELATDIYVPAGEGPFPILLQRTPYDRSDPFGVQFICQMTIVRALDAGFVVAVQDTRGRLASGGAFDPFVHEGPDGADTVSWLRQQDFSNGQICSFGASYIGATQTLLAMQGAEGHIAMAPFLTSGDFHEPWTYRGGALQLGFTYLWVIESLGPLDVEHRGLAADHPARAILAQLMDDPRASMEQLPVLDDAMIELAPYLEDWFTHPIADKFWADISPLEHVADIKTAALHIGGFNDIFAEGNIKTYLALRRHGATEDVRNAQYLILGPWSHGNISDWQGREWFGYDAAAAVKDLTGLQLEFFSAIAAGRQPNMPRVQYFTSGANIWQSADEWPPPTNQRFLYLGGAGSLAPEPAEAEASDSYSSNPLDPVPTAGGQSFLPGIFINTNDGPQDQSAIEARDDVLVYRSDPLDAELEVTGHVTLELWAGSTALDCDWTARLVDVDENGRALGIADGILRSRYRKGSTPTPLNPGQSELFQVEIGSISHLFKAGHQVGLQVASSNFPRFDRNPQQMVDPVRATEADFVHAHQSVYRGGTHASRLVLPVVP